MPVYVRDLSMHNAAIVHGQARGRCATVPLADCLQKPWEWPTRL